MSFPTWAPANLIEEHTRLKDKADWYRQRLDGEDDWDLFHDACQGQRFSFEEEAAKIDETANILFRLLTREDMRTAWVALDRECKNPRFARFCKEREGKGAYLLWDFITRAFKDFEHLVTHHQTASEKKKSLLSIAKKTEELLTAINSDPTASGVAWNLMSVHLAMKNLDFREKRGETPSEAEFTMPLTMEGDCDEARLHDDNVEENLDNWRWNDQPLVSRLEYWVREVGETHLKALLRLFADTIKNEANVPPEIKQPGRARHAIRPFLLRRVSEYVQCFYGQPLDDTVAQIVTAALDLDQPLTRDDVRPYTSQRGKKLASQG